MSEMEIKKLRLFTISVCKMHFNGEEEVSENDDEIFFENSSNLSERIYIRMKNIIEKTFNLKIENKYNSLHEIIYYFNYKNFFLLLIIKKLQKIIISNK